MKPEEQPGTSKSGGDGGANTEDLDSLVFNKPYYWKEWLLHHLTSSLFMFLTWGLLIS